MSFVLILYFDWLLGPHKGQNFEKKNKKKHSKISSETVKWMNPVLCIHVPDSSHYIICVFYSSWIRTLVAHRAYSIVVEPASERRLSSSTFSNDFSSAAT